MERFFDRNLDELRINLNRMAELAYANVNSAVQALIDRDTRLAKRTVKADEEIDELNKWVDQHVVEHISLCSPVATDVRMLYTSIKGSRDLERTGDEATTIAKRARKIIRSGYTGELFEIPTLCHMATRLLNESMASFLGGDLETAMGIKAKDKEIDKLFKRIDKQISRKVGSGDINPRDAPSLIDLMFISKSLERVGDHAANIAMEVIYFLTGKDHRHLEEARKS